MVNPFIDIINPMNKLQIERHPISGLLGSEFLCYLVEIGAEPGNRLPPIPTLAKELGISSGKLREQLEVARELGFVEVRPKTGIRVMVFDFYASIRTALRFALALDPELFEQFGVMRNNLEAAFWHRAVQRLLPDDRAHLQHLMERAWEKLGGNPIQIPHSEHRELHMTIFSRLNNIFVLGLLEAYWDGYEAVGLNLYADYGYLQKVWTYHGQMVDAILRGDLEAGYNALVEHTGLLQNRPEMVMERKAIGSPNGPEPVPSPSRRESP